MMWSWLLSALGIGSLVLLGKKNRWGFAVGFIADIAWGWYALDTHQWGFLPACLIYVAVHVHNWIKWGRADIEKDPPIDPCHRL